MTVKKLKVLVADDEQLARQRLVRLLSAMPDVEVAGEANDGGEVLTQIAAGGIDAVLLDIQNAAMRHDCTRLLGHRVNCGLKQANGPR